MSSWSDERPTQPDGGRQAAAFNPPATTVKKLSKNRRRSYNKKRFLVVVAVVSAALVFILVQAALVHSSKTSTTRIASRADSNSNFQSLPLADAIYTSGSLAGTVYYCGGSVVNPKEVAIDARVTVQLASGAELQTYSYDIPPSERETWQMQELAGDASCKVVGVAYRPAQQPERVPLQLISASHIFQPQGPNLPWECTAAVRDPKTYPIGLNATFTLHVTSGPLAGHVYENTASENTVPSNATEQNSKGRTFVISAYWPRYVGLSSADYCKVQAEMFPLGAATLEPGVPSP